MKKTEKSTFSTLFLWKRLSIKKRRSSSTLTVNSIWFYILELVTLGTFALGTFALGTLVLGTFALGTFTLVTFALVTS